MAWVLKHAHGWEGFESLKTVPSKQQIHRTLKQLWFAGVIVASRYKEDRPNTLPGWVIKYESAATMQAAYLESRIAGLVSRVNRAVHGVNFFGKPFDQGATSEAAAALRRELEALLACSDDPRLFGCLAALDAGLPLPAGHLPKTINELRSLIQQHHPDKGGNRALFEQAKEALDTMRKTA